MHKHDILCEELFTVIDLEAAALVDHLLWGLSPRWRPVLSLLSTAETLLVEAFGF